jgi:hypothetical protein
LFDILFTEISGNVDYNSICLPGDGMKGEALVILQVMNVMFILPCPGSETRECVCTAG